MKYAKKKLVAIAAKIEKNEKLTPEEINMLSSFEKVDKEDKITEFLKKIAIPLALLIGFLISIFPHQVDSIAHKMPPWTNIPDWLLPGVDYLWDFIGEPVKKQNILYHVSNIILYSFGIIGIKKLFDAIDRRSWIDKVNAAKYILVEKMNQGILNVHMKKGHSVLFIGKGDFIGMQFVLNHSPDMAVVLGETKPLYTSIWNLYNVENGYEDLKTVIDRTCEEGTGEYIFFPIKDDQIFLPSPSAYDVSPHKLDILCQDIRMIEKKNKWKEKRILIVGDKFHKSFVQSEDQKGKIKHSEDEISILTISKKYKNVTIIDPTDIVLRRILEIAGGRKIVFRATKEGVKEYKDRFYKRLKSLGYKSIPKKKGILTIGYDIFEDQTEQQTLSGKINDYYPVVLSKNVRDALVRNGYRKTNFIYVPELVLTYLTKKAAEQ